MEIQTHQPAEWTFNITSRSPESQRSREGADCVSCGEGLEGMDKGGGGLRNNGPPHCPLPMSCVHSSLAVFAPLIPPFS